MASNPRPPSLTPPHPAGLWVLSSRRQQTSALRIAAGRGYGDCARHLLLRGAAVDAVVGGRAPLHDSVAAPRPDCARLLLAFGADPNLLSAEGSAPLHLCTTPDSLPYAPPPGGPRPWHATPPPHLHIRLHPIAHPFPHAPAWQALAEGLAHLHAGLHPLNLHNRPHPHTQHAMLHPLNLCNKLHPHDQPNLHTSPTHTPSSPHLHAKPHPLSPSHTLICMPSPTYTPNPTLPHLPAKLHPTP